MRILDNRKSVILQAIINDYVSSAEPVGSSGLVERYSLGVRAATVRNEMAEMSELGYLLQPHTSAGRIPSCLGYRYYVDRLIPVNLLDGISSLSYINAMSIENPNAGEIDWLLSAACKILANATHTACIATAPAGRSGLIKEVVVTRPSPDKLVMVVIEDTGMVEHRLIALYNRVSDAQLAALMHLVEINWVNKSIDDISSGAVVLPDDLLFLEPVWQVIEAAMESCVQALSRQKMFWDGLQYLFEQPEFQTSDRLTPVLELLSDKSAMARLLKKLTLPPKAHTTIGDENPVEKLHQFSFVVSTYQAGDQRTGQLCVIGPTRMNYALAITSVETVAQALTDVMEQMNISD